MSYYNNYGQQNSNNNQGDIDKPVTLPAYPSYEPTNFYKEYLEKIQENTNKIYASYENEKANLTKQREEEYQRGKSDLEKSAEDYSRQAYILKMQSLKQMPQQSAVLGSGGLSESGNINISANYQNKLYDINNSKLSGLAKLNETKQNNLNKDLSLARMMMENSIKTQQSEMEKYNDLFNNSQYNPSYIPKYEFDIDNTETQQVIKTLQKLGYNKYEIAQYLKNYNTNQNQGYPGYPTFPNHPNYPNYPYNGY